MSPAARIACVLAGVLAACDTGETSQPPGSNGNTVLKVPVGASPVEGPADAWVTIVEFSDFQCPFCGAVQPTLAAVLPAYGADVRLVFKHFPLSFHPYARTSAVASECAHAQGRFWEFHDLVFAAANRGTLFDGGFEADLATQAAQAGLDVTAWQACRGDPAMDARVVADMALASRAGVSGTPTFVVNGLAVVGAQPAATFRSAIDAALARAKGSGVPAAQYYDQVILGL